MHMPAEPFGEPVAGQFGLMARGIVHDDVNVEIGGDMLFDGVKEAAEFLRPVARHAFADDGSGLYVEGGKERGRPVPLIVMGAPLGDRLSQQLVARPVGTECGRSRFWKTSPRRRSLR